MLNKTPRRLTPASNNRTGLWAVLLTGLVLALSQSGVMAAPLTAKEIMQKVVDRDNGDNSVLDMEMVLIDKRGNERNRKIRAFGHDVGKDNQSIMFFLSPADVKGTGFLTYDYDESGKDDDQWLYLPALRKTKRIASSDKSGSFMGSDFFYSDMTKPDLNDYTYTLQKEVEFDGIKAWQIESVPKTEALMDETGYSKRVAFVRQDNFVVVRSVGWLYKSQDRKFMKVNKLEKIDGIWVETEIHVATKRGNDTVHQTILRRTNVKFNQKLSTSMFSERQLEKGI